MSLVQKTLSSGGTKMPFDSSGVLQQLLPPQPQVASTGRLTGMAAERAAWSGLFPRFPTETKTIEGRCRPGRAQHAHGHGLLGFGATGPTYQEAGRYRKQAPSSARCLPVPLSLVETCGIRNFSNFPSRTVLISSSSGPTRSEGTAPAAICTIRHDYNPWLYTSHPLRGR